MYSYFDLAKAYLLPTYAFKWNKNTKNLTILGRDPNRAGAGNSSNSNTQALLAQGFASSGGYDVAVRCFVAIVDEYLFDDELFVRYVIGKSKSSLGRMLGAFSYNLPGGVQVNSADLISAGDTEVQEVMDMINGENTPSYFLQWS
jgi:hypothetical protein